MYTLQDQGLGVLRAVFSPIMNSKLADDSIYESPTSQQSKVNNNTCSLFGLRGDLSTKLDHTTVSGPYYFFFRKTAKSFCRNFIRRGKIQKTGEKNTLKGQEKTLLTTDDHPGTLKVLRCQEDEERKNQKH